MIAAEPLDRHDLSLAQERYDLVQPERELGAAVGAAGGLGVEAAIGRVLVLAPALGAQLERGHGRVGAVVGNRAHDREARAAVGAVDERVPVAAVGRVEQLAQTVVAGGDIGRYECRSLALSIARRDHELVLAKWLDHARFDGSDTGQRRRLLDQRGREEIELLLCSFHLYDDTAGVVANETAELLRARQAVHERPKANPLHDPTHTQAPSLRHALTTLR